MRQKVAAIALMVAGAATFAMGGDSEASIADLAWLAGHWAGNR
jgi:hypothetical protein